MLFGHQNDANQPQTSVPDQPVQDFMPAQSVAPGVNPLAIDPATGASLPTVPPNSPGPVDTGDEPFVLNQTAGADTLVPPSGMPFTAIPVPATDEEVQRAASIATDAAAPVTTNSTVLSQTSTSTADAAVDQDPSSSSVFGSDMYNNQGVVAPAEVDNLLSLKQQVITQLSPLVNHLEQSPEEKFRTTMMLIQSTDNANLLQEAYNAAQNIPDEKVRAQALLDVVNEINYFTQQKGNE